MRISIASKLTVEGRPFIGTVKRSLMSKLNCIDVIISKSNYRLTPILVGVERSNKQVLLQRRSPISMSKCREGHLNLKI